MNMTSRINELVISTSSPLSVALRKWMDLTSEIRPDPAPTPWIEAAFIDGWMAAKTDAEKSKTNSNVGH